MSPRHISTQEARARIEQAKKHLHESIQARTVDENQIEYLQGVLDRGIKNCDKSEQEFQSKYS